MKDISWITLKDFPRFEIHRETHEVRLRAYKKVSTHRYYDLEGNLMEEYESSTNKAAKPMKLRPNGTYTLLKSGNQVGRVITRLVRENITHEKQYKYQREKIKPDIKMRF
ncbi:hypothetical protein LCGC14_1064260 [marine sediment metagenome]|uniref:Uncharacterized protein n=2 Tax=root TaxID=1 RepID=A0A831QQE9_9FLAO|nr:hypothetical protein [Pricia sp.]HEA22760.1 hypothetical protein [Pricia antarctica]